MTDLDDPNSVRSLLKKLWCHGQAISPFQGLAYAVWALSDDAAVSGSLRILLRSSSLCGAMCRCAAYSYDMGDTVSP